MSEGKRPENGAPREVGEEREATEEPANPILAELFELIEKLEEKRTSSVLPYRLMPMELGQDLVENCYGFLKRHRGVDNLDIFVTSQIHTLIHAGSGLAMQHWFLLETPEDPVG